MRCVGILVATFSLQDIFAWHTQATKYFHASNVGSILHILGHHGRSNSSPFAEDNLVEATFPMSKSKSRRPGKILTMVANCQNFGKSV